MPRLNVYIPAEVYQLAAKWRESVNLSEICARAIRDELEALDGHRAVGALNQAFRAPSELERALIRKFSLIEALTTDEASDELDSRQAVGRLAARYMDRMICDDSLIAIAGGRQMWCVVQNLMPRRVRATITALGLHQADPELLHVHPNSLTTILWLLYSPRSVAHVIGTTKQQEIWNDDLPIRPHPTYFVISSCSRFIPESPFANLLGDDIVRELLRLRVVGDFAYAFLPAAGAAFSLDAPAPRFTLSPRLLNSLSRRSDARTIVVAAGNDKVDVIVRTLSLGLSNTLITDYPTGLEILKEGEGGHAIIDSPPERHPISD